MNRGISGLPERVPKTVLQLVGSLARAGEERVAVEVANALGPCRYESHLCAARAGGPLSFDLAPHVRLFELERQGRFDLLAIRRLRRYCLEHAVDIVHAHGTSVFLAVAALWRSPVRLVWHDHWGQEATRARRPMTYGWAVRRCAGVISVSRSLAGWSREELRFDPERIWVLPNFLSVGEPDGSRPVDLGTGRVVCVAHFRAHKGHLTLVRAFARVLEEVPEARLVLIGEAQDVAYHDAVLQEIRLLGCDGAVSVLGLRDDVEAQLRGCSVGVLSSLSEGFPVTLLEYGRVGLACVATDVGECAEILDSGRAGLVVRAGSVTALAGALHRLLKEPELRRQVSCRAQRRVAQRYSTDAVVEELDAIYDAVHRGGS